MAVRDQAWELAKVIVHDETRATTIVAALAASRSVRLSSPPLAAYAAETRREWRLRAHDTDPVTLAADLETIFDRLGMAVRNAVTHGEWDWGDHPPASFASWLEHQLAELHDAHLRNLREQRTP
jgi:hypothetical protein